MFVNKNLYSGLRVLCKILAVVFFLVDGLVILVVKTIKPYGDHCKYVKYTDIIITQDTRIEWF